jgi:hypothetical protein
MAYPLAIKNLPGRNILSFYVFFTMLFNGGIVPSYLMWSGTFHIKDTLFAQLLPNLLLSAWNVMMIRTYFTTHKIYPRIIKTAMTDQAINYPVGSREFTITLGKATNHYHRTIYSLSQPGQTTAQTDKTFRMRQQLRTLHQGEITGHILRFLRTDYLITIRFCQRVFINTYNPITSLLQYLGNDIPAPWIMPAFARRRCLHPDTYIGFRYRTGAVKLHRYPWWQSFHTCDGTGNLP